METAAKLAAFLAIQFLGLVTSGCLTGYVVNLGAHRNHLVPDRSPYSGAVCRDGTVVIDGSLLQDMRPPMWWDVAHQGDDHYGLSSGGTIYRRFVVVPPGCLSRPPDRVEHEGGRYLERSADDGGTDVAIYELTVDRAGGQAVMFPFHTLPVDAVIGDLPEGIARQLSWSGDRLERGDPHFVAGTGMVAPIQYLPDGQSQPVRIRLLLPPEMQTQRRWWFWPSKVFLPPALLVDSCLLLMYALGAGA